jgi:hypothetical protein
MSGQQDCLSLPYDRAFAAWERSTAIATANPTVILSLRRISAATTAPMSALPR